MKFSRYVCVCLAIITTGCSTTGLKQWTDQELSPYLVKELTQHPRFKQEPIILVDLKGEQIEAQIDQLTATVREKMFNQLLEHNGANLIWQSSTNSLQHHRQLQNLQCSPKQKARFYVGFDVKPMDDQFQLSVKALDIEQGKWVSGFGKTWHGNLSNLEKKQLKQTHTDEMLRGLRALPFTEKQNDLLANYLARNVSCLLQQSQQDELVIYPELAGAQNVFVQSTLALVGNYLSRFNEVTIVDNAKKATIILKVDLHKIDKDLHQLWLIAQDKKKGDHVKGMDTAAYVSLSNAVLNTKPVAIKPRVQPIEVVIEQKPAPLPDPVILSKPIIRSADIFNSLHLIHPIGESFCQTSNPWVMGEYRFKKQAVTSCFGLHISVNQQTEVFLVNENSLGQVTRLMPDNGQSRFELFSGEQLRYPESNLFTLESANRTETIHAIAISNPRVANQMRGFLGGMPECCEQQSNARDNWQAKLKELRQHYGQYIEWKQLKVKR